MSLIANITFKNAIPASFDYASECWTLGGLRMLVRVTHWNAFGCYLISRKVRIDAGRGSDHWVRQGVTLTLIIFGPVHGCMYDVRNVGPAGRLPYALKKVNNHFLALSVGHYSCSLLLSHPVSFFLFILSILVVCPKMEPRPSFPKSIPRRPLYPQDDSRFGFPPW